jgi:hypothetical protein
MTLIMMMMTHGPPAAAESEALAEKKFSKHAIYIIFLQKYLKPRIYVFKKSKL